MEFTRQFTMTREQRKSADFFVNFAVNHTEANSIVNFVVNYTG